MREQGNTYSYAATTSSAFGWFTRTVLQFEDGTATYRRFEESLPGADGGASPPQLTVQWEERGSDVGSHAGAAPAMTVDQLYARCAAEVLPLDPAKNYITLEFDDRNLLKSCSFFPKNCADDCGAGVWLSELGMGKKY